MKLKSILAAGALAVSMPFAASAATVTGDFSESPTVNNLAGTGVVGTADITDLDAGGGSVKFDFKVTPKARSVKGIGTFRRTDTIEGLSLTGITPIAGIGGEDFGLFTFGPKNFGVDETFSLTFSWTGAASTDNIDFDIELHPVPVPAAGLMLLSVLGGGAFVARRKKKADA